MPTYNPLDSRFLTTANAITRDGQKFVRIILDIQDNVFYTLDDDGNFNPIGSGGTSSSGVTSINVGTGLSANSTTGAVTIINTSPNQSVSISGGTDIEVTGSYPNFGINFTGTTFTGVTGSGVVNTLNGAYFYPIWTATTPTASAVTTTEITNSSLYETAIAVASQKLIAALQGLRIGISQPYDFPIGGGIYKQILVMDANENALEWQYPSAIIPNDYIDAVGDFATITTNQLIPYWDIYTGIFTRHIYSNNIVIGTGGNNFEILIEGASMTFLVNFSGEIANSGNHHIQIGWSLDDATEPNIPTSYQTIEVSNSQDVNANFNGNFLVTMTQGIHNLYLFGRNKDDLSTFDIGQINVTITTIASNS